MVTLTKTQFLFFGGLNGLVLVGDTFETLETAIDGGLAKQAQMVFSSASSICGGFDSLLMSVGDFLHWISA